MASDMSNTGPEFPQWMVTIVASSITFIGGIVAALVNRSPALQNMIDSRLKTLIDGYKDRINDLEGELKELKLEITRLRNELTFMMNGKYGTGIIVQTDRVKGDPDF